MVLYDVQGYTTFGHSICSMSPASTTSLRCGLATCRQRSSFVLRDERRHACWFSITFRYIYSSQCHSVDGHHDTALLCTTELGKIHLMSFPTVLRSYVDDLLNEWEGPPPDPTTDDEAKEEEEANPLVRLEDGQTTSWVRRWYCAQRCPKRSVRPVRMLMLHGMQPNVMQASATHKVRLCRLRLEFR